MNFKSILGLKPQKELENRWRDFETEVMPFTGDIFRIAMWLTRNREEAEDLVQETLFQALRSFHRYEMGTNCRAWLLTILYNLNAKRLRSLTKMRIVEESEERLAESIPFEPSIPQQISDEEISKAIDEIPTQFREVILLSDIEELSYKEISQILGIPIGTVMSRLHRARRILRVTLSRVACSYGIGSSQEQPKDNQLLRKRCLKK